MKRLKIENCFLYPHDLLCHKGNFQGETCTVWNVSVMEFAAMVLSDGSGDGETEARGFTDRLCREERFKHLFLNPFRDHRRRIDHGKLDVSVLGFDGDANPSLFFDLCHGVDRIIQKVQEDLGELDG